MAGPDTRAGAAVTAHGSPRSAVEIGGIEIVLPGNEIVLPGNADQRE